jgi:DNA-nicking Smr family endonuclease
MSYFAEIDLHGQTVDSARKMLTAKLKGLPNDVRELRVIHGYHGGTSLQNFVRSYKNPRIERKILGLNSGETIFVIAPKS